MWRCLSLTILLLLVLGGPLKAEMVVGSARVVDGDTLDIGRTRIRLYGIDAPEGGQAYGPEASSTLAALTSGQLLSCEGTQRDVHGRLIAVCHVGATELNSTLVRLGVAWAFVRYSSNYVTQQEIAQQLRMGIWRDPRNPPKPPWDYRAEHRAGAQSEPTPAALAPTPYRAVPTSGFVCGTKRYCGEMSSCAEAKFYLSQCGLARLDADRDGLPCESLCR